MEKRIGIIGIVIQEREKAAHDVNDLLSSHSSLIVGRLGLPFRENNVSVISLIIEASTDEVGSLTGKLGMLKGVRVKSFVV